MLTLLYLVQVAQHFRTADRRPTATTRTTWTATLQARRPDGHHDSHRAVPLSDPVGATPQRPLCYLPSHWRDTQNGHRDGYRASPISRGRRAGSVTATATLSHPTGAARDAITATAHPPILLARRPNGQCPPLPHECDATTPTAPSNPIPRSRCSNANRAPPSIPLA